MKKLSIYMFAYLFPPEYTGASIQAITLAKALRGRGVQVTFVTATAVDANYDVEQNEGFPVIRIAPSKNSSNWSLLCFWFRVLKVLLVNLRNYDIIHVIGPSSLHNIIPWIGKALGKPTLLKTTLSSEIAQFKLSEQSGLEEKFNYYSTKLYSRIICISHTIMDELTRSTISPDRLTYIPNGVDTARFYPAKSENKSQLRRDLALPEKGIFFSYVGVLHKRKNLEWLIKRWLAACENNRDFYLVFAGPMAREDFVADGGGGPAYTNVLKKCVEELGGSSKVFFLPFRHDVEVYFQMTDFFINPSLSEGLSNSMLEAMASGAVPVVSETSGASDVICKGETGYLFGINDEKEFEQVIIKCCTQQEKYKDISSNAVEKINAEFSLEILCERYVDVYEELISLIDQ